MDYTPSSTLDSSVRPFVTRFDGDFFDTFGFTNGMVLGLGMSGHVTLSMPPDGSGPQALKMFFKESQPDEGLIKECFEMEVSILTKIRHRNIVEMIKAYESPNMYIISMRYYPDGDLKSLLPHIQEPQVGNIFIQLTCAVRYLHMNHIAHRDIKPDNILISSNGDAVLTDFGLACLLTPDEMTFTHFTGTFAYAAPEMKYGRPNDPINYAKCDMYSLGKVLWSMVVREKDVMGQENEFGQFLLPSQNAASYRCLLEHLLLDDAELRWDTNRVVLELWEHWTGIKSYLCHHLHDVHGEFVTREAKGPESVNSDGCCSTDDEVIVIGDSDDEDDNEAIGYVG